MVGEMIGKTVGILMIVLPITIGMGCMVVSAGVKETMKILVLSAAVATGVWGYLWLIVRLLG